MTEDMSETTERRRSGDFVTATQMDLIVERLGRALDKAVSDINQSVHEMGNKLERKIEQLDFVDRTLASRLDGIDLRVIATEHEIKEVSSRGSKNFKLILTSFVTPVLVGVVVFVLQRLIP